MLVIRLQRIGRKGLSHFRVIVQEHQHSPKSGKVTEIVGSFNPHTKKAELKTDRIKEYLKNGAQPSNRVIRILKENKVTLPKWVALDKSFKGKLKNPDKLRKNRPDEPKEAPAETEKAEEAPAETEEKPAKTEDKAEEKTEEPKEEAKKETEAPEEEAKEEKSK